MNVQFEGWRLLDATDVLRADDRWTYHPDTYKTPDDMYPVSCSYFLRAGMTVGQNPTSRPLYCYRRIEP